MRQGFLQRQGDYEKSQVKKTQNQKRLKKLLQLNCPNHIKAWSYNFSLTVGFWAFTPLAGMQNMVDWGI